MVAQKRLRVAALLVVLFGWLGGIGGISGASGQGSPITCGRLVGTATSWGGGGTLYAGANSGSAKAVDGLITPVNTQLIVSNPVANSTYFQFSAPGPMLGISYFHDITSQYSVATIKGSNDGATWVNIVTGAPFNSGRPLTTFPSVQSYLYYRIVPEGFSGSYFRLAEVDATQANGTHCTDAGIPYPTATVFPTNTPQPSPTASPTPLAYGTPVQLVCGGPGQIPCHVYWLTPGPVYITGTVVITGQVSINNWPTPIPSSTPFGGGAQETALAVSTSGPGAPPAGSLTGVEDRIGFPDGAGGQYDVVVLVESDWGCPLVLPMFSTSLCFTYREVAELNLLGIEVPIAAIGSAILVIVVYRMVQQA